MAFPHGKRYQALIRIRGPFFSVLTGRLIFIGRSITAATLLDVSLPNSNKEKHLNIKRNSKRRIEFSTSASGPHDQVFLKGRIQRAGLKSVISCFTRAIMEGFNS